MTITCSKASLRRLVLSWPQSRETRLHNVGLQRSNGVLNPVPAREPLGQQDAHLETFHGRNPLSIFSALSDCMALLADL